MSTPNDNPLVKWLLLYVTLGAVGLIVAFGVGGDPLAERVVQFFLPAGAVLFVLVQGGKIESKADATSGKIDQIHTAVNGELTAKFTAVNERIDDLAAVIEARLPPS